MYPFTNTTNRLDTSSKENINQNIQDANLSNSPPRIGKPSSMASLFHPPDMLSRQRRRRSTRRDRQHQAFHLHRYNPTIERPTTRPSSSPRAQCQFRSAGLLQSVSQSEPAKRIHWRAQSFRGTIWQSINRDAGKATWCCQFDFTSVAAS